MSAHPLHCADLGQRVGANLSAEGELVSSLSSMAPRLRRGCLCEVETPPPPRPPSPVVFLCDLAVMYVIGFWLNKNLKLHTHCVSAKPAFTTIGARLCTALLAADFWDPRLLSLPGC